MRLERSVKPDPIVTPIHPFIHQLPRSTRWMRLKIRWQSIERESTLRMFSLFALGSFLLFAFKPSARYRPLW